MKLKITIWCEDPNITMILNEDVKRNIFIVLESEFRNMGVEVKHVDIEEHEFEDDSTSDDKKGE